MEIDRKTGQKIVMEVNGQKVTVTIVSVDGDRVKIGIEAPREIPIYRNEHLKESK